MPSYLHDALDRIAAMQKEALNTITAGKVDAVPYWPYQQESFPYFTNRLGSVTYEQVGQDLTQAPYVVLMRLVIAHLTEGYKGEPQDRVYDYIPEIETYFWRQHNLTTTGGSYTARPPYLSQAIFIASHTGLVVFQNAGTFANQVGVEFTLETPFIGPQIVSEE